MNMCEGGGVGIENAGFGTIIFEMNNTANMKIVQTPYKSGHYGSDYKKASEVFQIGKEVTGQFTSQKFTPLVHGKEKVYPKGHVYDFYKDIRQITKNAEREVFVIDAYVNEELLDLYLEKISSGVRIRILTNKPQGNFIAIARKFRMRPNIRFEVRRNEDCHDRLFIVDENCWVIGQSVKDAGKKPTYLMKIEGYNLFKNVFEDLWKEASVLV